MTLRSVRTPVRRRHGPRGAAGPGLRGWSWCLPPRPTGSWAGRCPPCAAVSDRNMSLTTSRSSAFRPRCDCGRRRAPTPRCWRPGPAAPGCRFVVPPIAASNSQADRPGPGSELSSTPQTRGDVSAMLPGCRACGSREAGRPSGRAPARPARCPAPSGMPKPQNGLPTLPSASARLMKASTLSTPLALLLRPARGQDHGGLGGAEHARGVARSPWPGRR